MKCKRSKFIDCHLQYDVKDESGRRVPVLYDFYDGHILIDYRLNWGDSFSAIKKYLDSVKIEYIEKTAHAYETQDYHGMTEFPVLIIANRNFSNSNDLDSDFRYFPM